MRARVLLSIALIAVPVCAAAQVAWQVTVTPTLDPLPAGFCAAVHLSILDASGKDVPRNPQGYRITMADFDMSVAGGNAAGQQIDPYHWNVCACQGAGGGTATITANYPARSLSTAARVTGANVQKSATVTIAPPKGTVNPAPCLLAGNTNSNGGNMVAGNTTVTPLPAADPYAVRPARPAEQAPPPPAPIPTIVAPLANEPINAPLQTRTAVAGTTPPVGTPVGTPIGTPATPPAVAPAAPPAAAPALTSTEAPIKTPVPLPATPPTATPPAATPALINPSGLAAVQTGPGQVLLTWQPVSGASFYGLFGPGVPEGAVKLIGTTNYVATSVGAGSQEWAVASFYEPGPKSTAAAAFTRVTLNVTAPAAPPAATPPATTTPAVAPVQSGRYLVTITGLRNFRSTKDDPLSRDGMGDEIYAAAYVRRFDRVTGQIAESSIHKTVPYGDVLYFGGQRLQAGSWSATGGIKDNDPVPDGAYAATRTSPAQNTTFPLRLWEGTLTDEKDVLVISPSLWEQDVTNSYYLQWEQQQQMLNLSMLTHPRVRDQITQKTFAPLIVGVSGNSANSATASIIQTNQDIMFMTTFGLPIAALLTTSGDRPIGLVAPGRDVTALPNRVVVLTREIVEAALAQPPRGAFPGPLPQLPGVPAPTRGVMMVTFYDDEIPGFLGFPEPPAYYQMFIQVERVP